MCTNMAEMWTLFAEQDEDDSAAAVAVSVNGSSMYNADLAEDNGSRLRSSWTVGKPKMPLIMKGKGKRFRKTGSSSPLSQTAEKTVERCCPDGPGNPDS